MHIQGFLPSFAFIISLCSWTFKWKSKNKKLFKTVLKETIEYIKNSRDDQKKRTWKIKINDDKKYLLLFTPIFSYSREMNKIMLKYAIIENKEFNKENKYIIEEDPNSEPAWYAKFRDKTFRMITGNDSKSKQNNYLFRAR